MTDIIFTELEQTQLIQNTIDEFLGDNEVCDRETIRKISERLMELTEINTSINISLYLWQKRDSFVSDIETIRINKHIVDESNFICKRTF